MADSGSLFCKGTRSSRGAPNPFRSPKISSHNALPLANRTSLKDFSVKMKARKIHLYRNGDQFFKGMTFAITDEHFRTFNSFLSEINKSVVCDPSVLKKGVRCIFTLNGDPVTTLNQLEEGHSYVCSSTPAFRKLDYENISGFSWYTNFSKNQDGPEKSAAQKGLPGTEFLPSQPKMVVVIRAGPRPRNLVRMLLNRRTATSYDQVLTHLAGALNMKTGTIRKMYSLTGQQIHDLTGFYSEDKTFVATDTDRISMDDLQLSDEELKFVESSNTRMAIGEGVPRTGISDQYNSRHASHAGARHAFSHPETRAKPVILQEDQRASLPSQLQNVRPASPPVKPKVITIVNRGHSGENYGIPIPLLAKYKIGRVLAKGNCVLVKRCYEKNKPRSLALKIIETSLLNGAEQIAIEHEVSVIGRLSHPNILLLVDELTTPSEIYLIMEYFKLDNSSQGGFLLNFVLAHEHNENEASKILLQLCLAVAHMHSLNLIHRNIRPEKILVFKGPDGNYTVKLGDFGMAIEATELQYKMCGTAAYMAPEMLACTGYGVKVDVWSCGVIMYILLSGQPPFARLGSDSETVLQMIRSGPVAFPSPQWDCISDSGKDLIMFMLEVDISTRGSASDLLDHPWLSNPNQGIRALELHPSVQDKIRTLTDGSFRDADPCATLITTTTLDRGQNFSVEDEKGEPATSQQPFLGPSDTPNLG